MKYCLYFQAEVRKEETWFFVATLRSNEHLCFDRTLKTETGLFEFFVPFKAEDQFLSFMERHIRVGRVCSLVKLPNRLLDPTQHL